MWTGVRLDVRFFVTLKIGPLCRERYSIDQSSRSFTSTPATYVSSAFRRLNHDCSQTHISITSTTTKIGPAPPGLLTLGCLHRNIEDSWPTWWRTPRIGLKGHGACCVHRPRASPSNPTPALDACGSLICIANQVCTGSHAKTSQ